MGHHYYNPARYGPSSLARRPCKPQTVERQHLLAKFDRVPDADLAIGSNGAWRWARSRPDREEFSRTILRIELKADQEQLT